MIDLTKRALPDTVTVDGKAYLINTDYRIWLQFEKDYKHSMTTGEPFRAKYIFPEEEPNGMITETLLSFARPPRELPRQVGCQSGEIVLDFDIDSDLIYAAFFETYGIDLLSVDMHYYIFLALLQGISESTKLAKVMGYRLYEKSTSKADYREELKRAWRIEPPRTAQEQADIDELERLFGGNEQGQQMENYSLKPEPTLPD